MSSDGSDMQRLQAMSREQLHAHATRYFKQGGSTEPEVALVNVGQAWAIFKDYARTPGWFGRVIAPTLLWREASALRRLSGLTGIPRLYRQLDARGLLMEYLPAVPWPQAKPPTVAYERLAVLICAMHERGVAHGDLRSGGNMLVDQQGQPYIVDFVARIHRGAAWNLPWNWFYRQFVAADQSALVKLRVRYARHLATAEDRRSMAERGLGERIARAIGASVRRCVRFFTDRG